MDKSTGEVLTRAVEGARVGIVVTDPGFDDNPITYVNSAFAAITQYNRHFAIGRNLRFLHGELTEPELVDKFEEAIRQEEECDVVITLHKADGTPFRSELLAVPVFGDNGAVSAMFCVQRELGDGGETRQHDRESLEQLRELQHRVKNHLAMVVSMIRVQAGREVTKDSFTAIARRIEALALLYEEMFVATANRKSRDRIKAGAYLSRIANVLADLEWRSGIRINVTCEEVDLCVDQAARLGLLLSELLTNALEHAFEGRTEGAVNIQFRRLSGGAMRLVVEDDGVGLPAASDWPYSALPVSRQHELAREERGTLDTTGAGGRSGVGGTIVLSLSQALGATLHVNRALHGTIVIVDFEPEW